MSETPPSSNPPPFQAYVGNEPYIFVTYAPDDRAQVYPELLRLHQAGYRVWYDDGTATGDAQTTAVETAILNCALFVVFVSPRLSAFRNARHEVQLAVDEDKPFVAVYLEPTDLKAGLNLLLSGKSKLHRHALSQAHYHDALRKILPEAAQAQTPFDAYLGDEPFIFVSYAHKDSALVFPEILRLHEQGYRIWYDQGIPIESNWRGSIGAALRKCAVFVVFITPRSVASAEVFAEVSVGFDRWKKNRHSDVYNFVTVYLEETDLPDDWYVFGVVQGLLPYQVPTAAYRRALDKALDKVKGIRLGDNTPEPTAAGTIVTDTPKPVELEEYDVADVPPLSPTSLPDLLPVVSARQWVKPRRKLNDGTKVRNIVETPKIPPAGDSEPVQSVSTVAEPTPPTKRNPKDDAEMILIPAGDFLMGDEDQNDNPRRTVTLDSFYLAKNLVTVAQYRKFCADTKRKMPEAPSWGWKDDHPIVNVSWEDANAYCKWAGGYLPTEAQWEKAARGTGGRQYPWGNEWDTSRLQCSKKEYADAKSTAAVGSFPNGASPYDVLDMAGNVWEWCVDWYEEDYYKSAPSKNPTGPEQGTRRVLRGCSWVNLSPDLFRSAYRYGDGPTNRNGDIGFRVASGL